MNNKIKSINGALLQAILKGANVFQYKSTETRSYIIIEQKNGFFLPEKPDQLTRYRYVLFISDHNGLFHLSEGFNLAPAQMMRHLLNEWDSMRKTEQKKKKHFK